MTKTQPNRPPIKTAHAQHVIAGGKTSRESALLALLWVFEKEGYLSEFFDAQGRDPLAQEIAYGSLRYYFSLQKRLQSLISTGRLKRVCKLLLISALYQLHFLTRAPAYAIVDETVKLAKKYAPYQVGLFNALLRSYQPEPLPVRDNYPEEFLKKINDDQVLEVLNCHFEPFARLLGTAEFSRNLIIDDCRYYMQNPTPYFLMQALKEKMEKPPRKILDLCAAPGGKSLILNEFYPNAQLHCNEVSHLRMERLKSNLKKYNISAQLHEQDGRQFQGEMGFDLIVIDAPCSGTGVMHKKPEAKLRLTDQYLKPLVKMQKELIEHARKLLAPGGSIWYLTCSILDEENHQGKYSQLQLPTQEGLDGGFAAITE